MIPQGDGAFEKSLYVWVASLALKVPVGDWPIYPVGLCDLRSVSSKSKTGVCGHAGCERSSSVLGKEC